MFVELLKYCMPEQKNGFTEIILSFDLLAMLTTTAMSIFKDFSFFNSSFNCFSTSGVTISR